VRPVTSGSPDRYEPLPGLLEIPGFLVRKIPPRARKPAAFAAALLGVAAAVALVFSIPAITESKGERAAADAQERRERRDRQVAELTAQSRVREGTGMAARGLTGASALDARVALADQMNAAILDDAHARMRSGELTQSVERVECERYPRRVGSEDPARDPSLATGRYSCLAVTADAPRTDTQNASSVGYPYRALVRFGSGRYAFCRVAGRPGEGALEREILVHMPPACGGEG
jgi:hypothetical protein